MLRSLLSLFTVLILLTTSFAGNVAILNMQKVIKESKAGKAIQSMLDKKVQELKKEVEKKQAAGEKAEDIQKFIFEKQQELNQLRQKKANEFMSILEKAVKEFAKKYNYDLVLDESPIIYGNRSLNKTEQFIKFFDKYYSTHKK